jgi:hypothetical protein
VRTQALAVIEQTIPLPYSSHSLVTFFVCIGYKINDALSVAVALIRRLSRNYCDYQRTF